MDQLRVDEPAIVDGAVAAVEVPGETTVVLAPHPTDEELELAAESEDPLGTLSYRQLVWRRFRKSRLGLMGGIVLLVFYTVAIFAEFFAPYDSPVRRLVRVLATRLRRQTPARESAAATARTRPGTVAPLAARLAFAAYPARRVRAARD